MLHFDYQKICQKLLNSLPQRQREVIERRFGLGSGERETLQKIGDDFGITRERVRQIESEAFSKLESKKEEKDLKKVFSCFEDY
jgi:RNA polymerase primary sigma factor